MEASSQPHATVASLLDKASMRPNEEGAGWTSDLIWSFGDLENLLHLP